MGKKYSSIHILSEQQDDTITILIDFFKQNSQYTDNIINAAQQIGNPELIRFTEKYLKLNPDNVIIVQSQALISIYDPALSFETIEDRTQTLSDIIAAPVFYISNFDDDVLVFGIFASGKQLTSGVVGEGLNIYGLELILIDIEKFADCSKIYDPSLNNALCGQDISAIENAFERTLNAPLAFCCDIIESDKRSYDILREETGVCIYKKKQ